jgi:hypothetical protein
LIVVLCKYEKGRISKNNTPRKIIDMAVLIGLVIFSIRVKTFLINQLGLVMENTVVITKKIRSNMVKSGEIANVANHPKIDW